MRDVAERLRRVRSRAGIYNGDFRVLTEGANRIDELEAAVRGLLGAIRRRWPDEHLLTSDKFAAPVAAAIAAVGLPSDSSIEARSGETGTGSIGEADESDGAAQAAIALNMEV